jgi:hypothetical protein
MAIITTGRRRSRVEPKTFPSLDHRRRTLLTTITTQQMKRPVKSITGQEIKAGWKTGSLKTTLVIIT